MKVPFANLSRKVKGLLKGSKKGHRIRITPFATAQHHVIGTINPELTSITIDETSIAYVRVNREHLENEIFLDGNYSAIRVERHVSESAKRALDENLANNSKEIQKWKKAAKKQDHLIFRKPVRKNAPKKSQREEELEQEINRLKNKINTQAGTIIEMMIAGLVPLHDPPPFPFFQVTQMKYGCDYLSYEWRKNELHLHWIEANLNRRKGYPGLTRNENRFKRAIENNRIVNHYHHMWVDDEGKQHWD